MKKFIAGFLSGAIIFSVVGVFAVNSIYDNPYKITVNGAEKYIQGYNIDDYSYFKLRDIADAVGGFSVGFDEQNQTIVLSTNEDIASPATPIEPAPATNSANPADTSSSDIDNLPLGTIPEPMLLERPNEIFDEVYVTNDEFQVITMYGEGISIEQITAKANKIVGEERYYEGFNGIRQTGSSGGEFLVEGNPSLPGAYTLEYYYKYVAPWLRSLKQAQ